MSNHSNLIKECDEYVRQIMKLLNIGTCDLCGKQRKDLGVMHILGKQAHPALRWAFANLLYAGWNCCHRPYDQEPKKKLKIIVLIEKKFGYTYRDKLIHMEKIMPKKLNIHRIKTELEMKYNSLKRVLK